MEIKNEKALIEGIRNKDNESLLKIMNYYSKLVYYIAGTILNKDCKSEYIKECYNEVFTDIWFNIESFNEKKGSFKGWIVAITRYKALNIKRKNLKYTEIIEYKDDILEDKSNDFEVIDNLEYLYNILENLNEEDRIILIKRYLEGKSIDEISIKVGTSKENIYTRISRTKKKLKNLNKDL